MRFCCLQNQLTIDHPATNQQRVVIKLSDLYPYLSFSDEKFRLGVEGNYIRNRLLHTVSIVRWRVVLMQETQYLNCLFLTERGNVAAAGRQTASATSRSIRIANKCVVDAPEDTWERTSREIDRSHLHCLPFTQLCVCQHDSLNKHQRYWRCCYVPRADGKKITAQFRQTSQP